MHVRSHEMSVVRYANSACAYSGPAAAHKRRILSCVFYGWRAKYRHAKKIAPCSS